MVPPPMEKFPYKYQIGVNRNSTIAHNRNGNNWDILFRWAIQNWEMDQLMELLADMERYNIDVTMADNMCWGGRGLSQ